MLVAALMLFLALLRDDGGLVAVSIASSVGALILLWAGVVRSSGPAQRHRDG